MLAKPPNIRHTCDLKALFHISTVILGPYVGQANVTCTVDKVKWGNSGQSSQFLVQHRQNLIDVHQIASAITSVCAFCKYVKSLLERQLSPRQGNSRHAG